ncbi:MAG TPA: RNA 2',3'-cyclic phosphodiesterase [Acidobacteria bacterium]|nr:RNA 2',3'-cyclic phosphodiesterase [Acidobacteriota bacterium]
MRLFVALEIPEAVRRDVARRVAGLRERLPRARWVDTSILHLTLLFLGEVDAARLRVLTPALRTAFAKRRPLSLRLAGAGTFPAGRPARVAWVGMETPGDLTGLQVDLTTAAVASIGFTPEERPFHPHVTLARCDPPWPRDAVEKCVAAFPAAIGQPWVADKGVLLESKLSPRGAQYRLVAELPFQAGEVEE